jgi:hypothetical protein
LLPVVIHPVKCCFLITSSGASDYCRGRTVFKCLILFTVEGEK